MAFQLLLTWSNRADSLGSCFRMSSPRKIFWGAESREERPFRTCPVTLCSQTPDDNRVEESDHYKPWQEAKLEFGIQDRAQEENVNLEEHRLAWVGM